MKSKFLKKIIAVAVVGTSISTFVSPNAFAVATNDFYAWQNMNSGQSNGIWKLNSGKWYFYNYSGIMQTGWIYDKGRWYYADYTGVMQTGVIQINGKIHLFSESGAMQTGNAVINGKYYSFDGNGVAVGKDIPTPINSFDLSGSTTIPYTPQIITDEDSSPSDPNTVARDPDNLIKYNVKFKDDDGDEFSTKTLEKDTKLTLYKPSKSGYTFVEWTTKKDGDGDSYEAGESITIKKNITLYAQWKEAGTSDSGTSTDKVAVEDVTVTSTAGTTTVGGTLTMTAKVLPINATEKGVTWSVSDSNVASISADGVLTAKAVGTVMVVATSKDASGAFGSTSIEVKVVAGAAITGLDGELQMGATVTAKAATTEAGAGNWTSSNKTVAEVDPTTGDVTAKAAGTTTISYTTSTSGNVNSKVITVKAISAGEIITGLDEALQMGMKETATAATTETGVSGWTSSNKEVATIDDKGFIKAIKAGYTTISYTSTSGKTNLKVLTVKAAAVVPGKPITGLGDELEIGAIATATTTEAGASIWKSSDKEVATVDESTGVVKAIKAGYATISYTKSTSGNVNSKNIIVKNVAVTASASKIETKIGTTTITLGKAIAGLAEGDIVVKKGTTALVKGTDYSLSHDLTGETFEITFLPHAALNNTSVVTVGITKAGYTINGGDAISVENIIPSDAPTSISELIVTLSGANVTVTPGAGRTMKYILASNNDISVIVAGKKADDTYVLSNLGKAISSGAGLNINANNDKYIVAIEIDENGYIVAAGVSNAISITAVKATSTGIATSTGTTIITLDQAITDLAAGDIVVKKGTATLVQVTDYSLAIDPTGKIVEIAFASSAALDNISIVKVNITKNGYEINSGGSIAVINTIPAIVTANSSGITAATGTTTIGLDKSITGLAAGDIVVKKGGVALVSGTDYTLGALTGTSVGITFKASAALNKDSVVTVEMTKAGYTINGGSPITVGNTIP